jgi:hypothetical protein
MKRKSPFHVLDEFLTVTLYVEQQKQKPNAVRATKAAIAALEVRSDRCGQPRFGPFA